MRILRNRVLVLPQEAEYSKGGILLPQGNASFAPINQIPNIGTVVVTADKYVDPLGQELKHIKKFGMSSDGQPQTYRPEDEKFVIEMDITVKAGDKIWFHKNAIRQAVENNDYYLHEDRKCYWVNVTEIFCFERDGIKYPHGAHCILIPIWETEEEIVTKSGLLIKSIPGKDSMRAVVWLVDEREGLKSGDVVLFKSKGAVAPIELNIDGNYYYRCLNREILAVVGEMTIDEALSRQHSTDLFQQKNNDLAMACRMLDIKNPLLNANRTGATHNDYNNERW